MSNTRPQHANILVLLALTLYFIKLILVACFSRRLPHFVYTFLPFSCGVGSRCFFVPAQNVMASLLFFMFVNDADAGDDDNDDYQGDDDADDDDGDDDNNNDDDHTCSYSNIFTFTN